MKRVIEKFKKRLEVSVENLFSNDIIGGIDEGGYKYFTIEIGRKYRLVCFNKKSNKCFDYESDEYYENSYIAIKDVRNIVEIFKFDTQGELIGWLNS